MSGLSFPPLFRGLASAGKDPFALACAQAKAGCDAGLVVYDLRPDTLRAALVFAPEVLLRDAMVMLPLCGVGFQNALGALAPPEVSVHLDWDGTIRINGATAGALSVAAAPKDQETEPDWLAVGLELALWPADEEGGVNPDVTALFSEGCADVDAPALLEAWVRHTLVWINRWLEEGVRPLHKEWQGIGHAVKSDVSFGAHTGTFLGVDETFGMILQSEGKTQIIPLTEILKEVP
ncbi:MAG: DUF4444 domain-containing protein [Roseobacter sp.]